MAVINEITIVSRHALMSKEQTPIYRYQLTRHWHSKIWKLQALATVFLMLNPSTADGKEDDATVRKCLTFATMWGCNELRIGNLFAYRSRHPEQLTQVTDPVGPDNRDMVMDLFEKTYDYGPGPSMADPIERAPIVVCAWGAGGGFMDQDQEMMGWLDKKGVQPKCLGVITAGHPLHPLYVPLAAKLVDFALPPWRG